MQRYKRTSMALVRFIGCMMLLLLSTMLFAQNATLTGKVTDAETGDILPGANVVVSSAQIQTGAATKSSGEFTIKNLPPGAYTVTISYIGYETKVLSEVILPQGETKILEIALALTGIETNPISITASRRAEKTLEAPASISVLDARDLIHQVAPSSDAALKNVTGLDFAETGVDRREIVLRGFNNAFSGATYVLTDYRQAAVASLGVNIHSIMPNMSVDLERVEVVLGPGSALYGAGVDAGVIHYISKDPFSSPGTTVSFSGGERTSLAGQFRHAGVAGRLGYKVTGQWAQANDWELDPNDPLDQEQLRDEVRDRNYDYMKLNFNGLVQYRFNDKVSLTATGGYSTLDATVLSGIGTVQADNFGYSYGQIRLQANRFFAQAYLNRNNAGDSFVYGTGQEVVDKSTLLNLQAQYDFEFWNGKEQLIVGVDYDRTTPDTDGTIYGRNEDRDLISETGLYAQSQTALSSKFDMTLAARADYNNIQEEFQFSPRVAFVYKPTPGHSVRATYNRAFASPGNNSNFLDILAGQIPGTQIFVRGRGSAFGFTFGRNPNFVPLVNSDLVAYSLNPATLGQPQPVGVPLSGVYNQIYTQLSSIPPSVLKTMLPPPYNQLSDQQIAGLIALLDPTLTQVGGFSRGVLGFLNPTTGQITPSATQDVLDIDPLKQTITQTFELGYKGLIKDRVLIAADAYYMKKKNFVGPLLMETPFALIGSSFPADLSDAIATGITNNAQLAATLAQLGATPEQIAQLLVGLAQPNLPAAGTPFAIVAPNENAPQPGQTPELMLAYRNFGNIDLWGFDLALQVLVTDRWTFFGNLSVVSDDFFDNEELDEPGTNLSLALNAPTYKSKLGFNYSVPFGISFNAAGRYVKGFPVLSGPYVGDLDNYFLLDIGGGYDLGRYAPGLRFDLLIQNILDNDHREFIGAPKIGRLAMARLSYSFR